MRQIIPLALLLLTTAPFAHAAPPGAGEAAAAPPALSLGPGRAITGQIASAQEVDRYTLEVVQDRTYVFETFDVTYRDGGTRIGLYTADGQLIYASWPGWGNVDQNVMHVAYETQSVEVRVSAAGGWTGSYSLRALAASGQPGAAWLADGEPNNMCQIGLPLAPDRPRAQRIAATSPTLISHIGDTDHFSFAAEAGRSYTVELAGLAPDTPEATASLTLLDPLDLADDTYDGSGPGGAPARLTIPAGPARQICIWASGWLGGGWGGAYTIAVAPRGDHRLFLPYLRR